MESPRALTSPVTLTTAELSYLLSLIHAESLIGAESAALFPPDEAAREALWAAGGAEVEADHWLVWDAEANHYRVNTELMILLTALANPEMVVLTQGKRGEQAWGVGHYFSQDVVAEMSILGGSYAISALDSPATMQARLANAIGLPETRQGDVTFELGREEAAAARQYPDAAQLAAGGIDPAAARAFADTLRTLHHSGTCTLLHVRDGQAEGMGLVGFLVSTSGAAWLGVPAAEGAERVRYTLAGREEFVALLGTLLVEVRA